MKYSFSINWNYLGIKTAFKNQQNAKKDRIFLFNFNTFPFSEDVHCTKILRLYRRAGVNLILRNYVLVLDQGLWLLLTRVQLLATTNKSTSRRLWVLSMFKRRGPFLNFIWTLRSALGTFEILWRVNFVLIGMSPDILRQTNTHIIKLWH